MKKLLVFLTIFLFGFFIHAQEKNFTSGAGKFKVQYFHHNIIKVQYSHPLHERNENISDAVILKPLKKWGPHKINLSNDQLIIPYKNGEIKITSATGALPEKKLMFELHPDEKIFGGGERAIPLNRRGYRLNLYNNPWYGYGEGADNLNYSVPFFTSSKGYALFFDNPSTGYLDIGKSKSDVMEYNATSGQLNVYIILGDFKEILQSYHKLTGTQPLPPRWAFGNLMSRFGYTSEAQVRDILAKMEAQNIPVDAVIFDLFWFGDSIKNTLGNLEWVNKKAWPNPKKMIQDFKQKGIKTLLVTEPFFVETSKNYKASLPYLAVDSVNKPYYLTDFYFGRGGLIDIFRKDAQQWFWQFYKKQMHLGVEAWWGDLGEPEKHPANLYHNLKDHGYNRLFQSNEVHNIYGHNWTKMLYNYYAKEYPQKRLFSLNRSGFAGSQRYNIFPWTGDVSRSWSGYKAQLPVLLGMSMSGVPYVHSDAGGFAGGEGDNELYVRWLQFAAFTPIFRPHGTALYEKDKGAFSFPSEAALIDDPYRSYAKEAIKKRYAFFPYNYSLAYQQAKWGKPLMAPLYYYYPHDNIAVKVEDEYFWGENILVVPVLEKGVTTRKYYLPEGIWYHYTSDTLLSGNKWHTDVVSLSKHPIFFKEGSFITQMPVDHLSNLNNYKGDKLSVVYVPSSKKSTTVLFNDDGKSKSSLAQKKYEIITFHSNGLHQNSLKLSIRSDNGRYPGRPANRQISLTIPKSFSIKKITVNNTAISGSGQNKFKTEENKLLIDLAFTGQPLNITISW